MIKIKKGLDLPIMGHPEQVIYSGQHCTHVALLGDDYVGMKPTMRVKVGDTVKKGEVLFVDKNIPEILYTSPGAGKIVEINRGEKRAFDSIVVELDGSDSEIMFESFSADSLEALGVETVKNSLLQAGLWPLFKTRPFSKVPNPTTSPHSIFINTMDTNPLSADPVVVINDNPESFINGLKVISNLTTGKKYLCKNSKSSIPGAELDFLTVKEFCGVHPAGNSGTHIHFTDPVSINKTVWSIDYHAVIAIGKLFTSGKLYTDRIVALCGIKVEKPRLVRTRVGANLSELLTNQLKNGLYRKISGSVLSGKTASGPFDYLGRFHNQVTVVGESTDREFLGWIAPGKDKFSIKKMFLSSVIPRRQFNFSTSMNGGPRAMVPIGAYEKVMPLDILPTFLLRALITKDTEYAVQLGCLELDEEDLSLLTFVCPSKYEYGSILRENLTLIEKDG